MQKNRGTFYNLTWKLAERFSAQIVSLIVSIVLARVLDPEHYGVVAIVMVFITLANVFVSDGLGSALIQKKDADAIDFSTVLFANIAFSIILYLILFFCSPLVSMFYGEGYEILTPVMRILGLRLILSSINSVQQAYVARQMIFRKFFLATLLGTVVSAIVGILMAYNGFGVWALVAQYLVNTTVDTFVLQISLWKWPPLTFSFKRLKALFSYGIKILGAGLLIQGYQEVRALIIGKLYSSDDLAYFDRGRQFPKLISTNIVSSITAVLFPKMSKEQDDTVRVKEIMRQSIRFSSYLMSPMMFGLAAVAKPLVIVLLTEKWIPCVLMLQIFSLCSIFNPIHSVNNQAYKAVGRSDLYLKLELIKKGVEIAVLLCVMWISPLAIAISMLATNIAFIFVNAIPNKRLIGYSLGEQMIDILPNVFMGLIMGVIVFVIQLVPMNNYLLLLIQVISGISIYLLFSIVFKNKEFLYLLNVVKSAFKKKTKSLS